MHATAKGVTFAIVLALCGPAFAVDDPDDLMPGRIGLVRPGVHGRFVAKPATTFNLPSAGAAPTVGGATNSLQLFDTTFGAAGADSYALGAGTWTGLGNPAGSRGYKYRGAGAGADPCKVVLVKTTVVKGVCQGAAIALTPPFAGDLGVVLTTGPVGTQKRFCALFGGTPLQNQASFFKRINAPSPGACPSVPPQACCVPQRITLLSALGTLQMDHLAPFPFPAGVLTTMDTAATDTGMPECHHAIIVPAGGFSAPHFDIPALNYCSEVIPLGCASGGADGKGNLWDAGGSVPAMAHVTKQADTSDGVCDSSFTGANCNTSPGGAGANTLGRIVTTRSASTTSGNRGTVDVPLRSLTWSDGACAPAFDPGCCITSTYGDDTVANGEMKISELDFIVSGTTDTATASFADLNGDGCKRAGVGFTNPGPDGPKSLTGVAAAGPCCTVGRSTTFVALGVGFTGGPPLFDVGFQMTSPNTIAACGAPAGGNCVLTTDPCLGSPSGAFLDPLG